jgi:hypothetical protein
MLGMILFHICSEIEAYRKPRTLAGELFAENVNRTVHTVLSAFAAFSDYALVNRSER